MGIERQKMLAGELYNPLDPELVLARERARDMPRSKRYARVAANRATPHSAGSLRSWGQYRVDAATVLLRLWLKYLPW